MKTDPNSSETEIDSTHLQDQSSSDLDLDQGVSVQKVGGQKHPDHHGQTITYMTG